MSCTKLNLFASSIASSFNILGCSSSGPQDCVMLVFIRVLRTHACVISSLSNLSPVRGSRWKISHSGSHLNTEQNWLWRMSDFSSSLCLNVPGSSGLYSSGATHILVFRCSLANLKKTFGLDVDWFAIFNSCCFLSWCVHFLTRFLAWLYDWRAHRPSRPCYLATQNLWHWTFSLIRSSTSLSWG